MFEGATRNMRLWRYRYIQPTNLVDDPKTNPEDLHFNQTMLRLAAGTIDNFPRADFFSHIEYHAKGVIDVFYLSNQGDNELERRVLTFTPSKGGDNKKDAPKQGKLATGQAAA